MIPDYPRRKRLHPKNFSYKGSDHIYFLTLCTQDSKNIFIDHRIAITVGDELEYRRSKNEIKLFCFCIMPDHLHILLSLDGSYAKSLQDWVAAFKRYTSKIAKESYGISKLWQRNFYDHVVRKEESLLKITDYILFNPVRKGIVSDWRDYPYSKMVDPLPF
jgi:putative transposase